MLGSQSRPPFDRHLRETILSISVSLFKLSLANATSGSHHQISPSVKKYGNKFSYVIVKDIAIPHAFDEAVKGVDVVAHTASPVDVSINFRFLVDAVNQYFGDSFPPPTQMITTFLPSKAR